MEEKLEAFRLTDDVDRTAPKWFINALAKCEIDMDVKIQDGFRKVCGCFIRGKTIRMRAKVGDYIVKGKHGEIYPCSAAAYQRILEREKREGGDL